MVPDNFRSWVFWATRQLKRVTYAGLFDAEGSSGSHHFLTPNRHLFTALRTEDLEVLSGSSIPSRPFGYDQV